MSWHSFTISVTKVTILSETYKKIRQILVGYMEKSYLCPCIAVDADFIKSIEIMKKYLDPKADLTFKKIFGEHKDLLISLITALLPLNDTIILIIIVAFCLMGAQQAKAQEALLRFDHQVIDAGTMTEDDAPRTYTFVGRNVSGRMQEITRIQTTCGCTKSSVSLMKLQPGDSCRIELTFTPNGYPGTIDTRAFVYLRESGKEPVMKIGLRGEVLPSADVWYRFKYQMGDLRLKQRKVTFTDVKVGMKPEARILCGNSGKKPLRISSLVLPQYAQVRTEPEVIVPGDEADLVITLLVDLIPPMMKPNFSFPIILEGVEAKPSDRTITVTVNRNII